MNLYAQRDTKDLDMLGDFFSKHMKAMSLYGLHSKEDIAAELGYRDMLIVQLRKVLLLERAVRAKENDDHEEWAHLANQALRTKNWGM
jgi:hypothetical protein